MNTLKDDIEKLPGDLQREVRDFIAFLLYKRRRNPAKPLKQDWAGALKKYGQQYTALQLQKKAIDWREIK